MKYTLSTKAVPGPTPGPWKVKEGFPTVVIPACDAGKKLGGADDPDIEAQLYAKQIHCKDPTDFPEFHRSRVVRGEAEANARLIAAAPDLLEALHLAAEALDAYSDVNDGDDGRPTPNRAMSALQDIGEVLAKAEGR